MAENQDVLLSAKATEVAQRFVDAGYFKTRSEAAVFAAAYILRTEFHRFDPASFTRDPRSRGSNYSYGTFDPEGRWSNLISALYDTDKPRLYFRNLMIYGLETMGEKIDQAGGVIQIAEFI